MVKVKHVSELIIALLDTFERVVNDEFFVSVCNDVEAAPNITIYRIN